MLIEMAIVRCEEASAASKAVGSLRRCVFSNMAKDEAKGMSSSCNGMRSADEEEHRTCSVSGS